MLDTQPVFAKRQRLLTCQDAVPELLAKGQLREAKSVCHEALEKLDENHFSAAEAADVWYLLGLVHDIAHEHEEVERCMRQAHFSHVQPRRKTGLMWVDNLGLLWLYVKLAVRVFHNSGIN